MAQKEFEKLYFRNVSFEKPVDTYFITTRSGEVIETQASCVAEALDKCKAEDVISARNITYDIYDKAILFAHIKLVDNIVETGDDDSKS